MLRRTGAALDWPVEMGFGPPSADRVAASSGSLGREGEGGDLPAMIAVFGAFGTGLVVSSDASIGSAGAWRINGATSTPRSPVERTVSGCCVERMEARTLRPVLGPASARAGKGRSAVARLAELASPGIANASIRVSPARPLKIDARLRSRKSLSSAVETAKNAATAVKTERARAPTNDKTRSRTTETEGPTRHSTHKCNENWPKQRQLRPI